MSESFDLSDVDRFVAGAVGKPGHRTFYFQISVGPLIVSLKCEKAHVGRLAEAFAKLLVDLPAPEPVPLVDDELITPVRPEWAVGSIGLANERGRDRILVVFEEAVPEGDEGARTRFSLTRAQAASFARQAELLVKAGRPTCVLCSSPIDPDGYTCHCFN
jgi:uncharacterized repeat protein (TIGR03847 family)